MLLDMGDDSIGAAKVTDLRVLLRPMTKKEQLRYEKGASPQSPTYRLRTAWNALYEGKLIADDIEALVEEIARVSRGSARESGRCIRGFRAGRGGRGARRGDFSLAGLNAG